MHSIYRHPSSELADAAASVGVSKAAIPPLLIARKAGSWEVTHQAASDSQNKANGSTDLSAVS